MKRTRKIMKAKGQYKDLNEEKHIQSVSHQIGRSQVSRSRERVGARRTVEG
jgi:hypothetical protein